LAILLEKCELATKSGESQPSVSLNDEVRIFLQRLEHEKVALEGKDKETNELVCKVLRARARFLK
jgi:hypothetical protein